MKTRIKEFRAKYDLTQEKLAEKVGVRRETIVFLEQGKYNPSLKLAHDVAKALKSKIEELFIFEQPGFLRLIFRLRDRSGLLGLLEVNQLLTQCAAAWMLCIAIANGRHASSEAEQGGEGNQGGNSYLFHVALWG